MITHGGSIDLFLVQPMLRDLCNKGCGMCYPVCGMVNIDGKIFIPALAAEHFSLVFCDKLQVSEISDHSKIIAIEIDKKLLKF